MFVYSKPIYSPSAWSIMAEKKIKTRRKRANAAPKTNATDRDDDIFACFFCFFQIGGKSIKKMDRDWKLDQNLKKKTWREEE